MSEFLNSLELSVRAHGVLLNNFEIETIDDFLAVKPADILRCHNAGRKTLNEIREIQEDLSRDHWPVMVKRALNRLNEILLIRPDDWVVVRDQHTNGIAIFTRLKGQ